MFDGLVKEATTDFFALQAEVFVAILNILCKQNKTGNTGTH